MSKERERIIVTMTDGTRYEGDISLHGRDRVVDTLNHPAPFFNLRNARVTDGGNLPLVVLAKNQVVSAVYVTPPAQEIKLTRVLRKGERPGSVFADSR